MHFEPMISVTVCSPSLDQIEPWRDLAARAPVNIFMHPAALVAAADTGFARVHVLLAWHETEAARRLVGFWALQRRRALPLAPEFLESLPYNYAFTSNAIVDPAFADEVIEAFFTAISRDKSLPKIVSLRSFDAQCDVHAAI